MSGLIGLWNGAIPSSWFLERRGVASRFLAVGSREAQITRKSW